MVNVCHSLTDSLSYIYQYKARLKSRKTMGYYMVHVDCM